MLLIKKLVNASYAQGILLLMKVSMSEQDTQLVLRALRSFINVKMKRGQALGEQEELFRLRKLCAYLAAYLRTHNEEQGDASEYLLWRKTASYMHRAMLCLAELNNPLALEILSSISEPTKKANEVMAEAEKKAARLLDHY